MRVSRRKLLGGVAASAVVGAGYLLWRAATRRRPDFSDIAYGPGPRQVLDIYLPRGAGPFPVVMDIHGGAFKIGSKTANPVPQALLDAGIAIARPNYRYSSTDPWPAQGEDCLAALAHLRAGAAGFGLDPARFALWGQSAGGFLAVSTALSLIEASDPPRAVVNFYGPMDFSTMDADMAALGRSAAMGATDAAGSAESQLLGFAIGTDPARARALGPIGRLHAMAARPLPPLFIRHGDADPMIAHGQSERLAQAWAQVDPGAEVDFALVAGAGHGGAGFDAAAVMDPLVALLQRSLA